MNLPTSRKAAKALGVARYFTGIACKNGHVAYRKTSDGHCIACNQERRKARGPNPKQRQREYSRQWREANPDRDRELKRQWTQRNPSHRRADVSNRRARIRNAKMAADAVTPLQLKRLAETQKHCHLCGKRFTKASPPTIDHVIPLVHGGRHEITNLALAHGACNNKKGARRLHLL